MAVCTMPTGREPHQTGEPRGLLPSGGSFTAKLACLPSSPAPKGRGVGCRALALLLLEDPFALEIVAEEEKKEIDGNLGDVVAPTQPEVQGAGQTGGKQHVENENAEIAHKAAATGTGGSGKPSSG